MRSDLIKGFLALPGSILIYIPAVILFLESLQAGEASQLRPPGLLLFVAFGIGILGLILMVWTTRLFVTRGRGTPAPWAPPEKLVVHGPYLYVRNPMLLGVGLVLLAESLVISSWLIAAWLVVFLLGATMLFHFREEPELERRFGEDYRTYKSHVPRWLPRTRAWKPTE